MIERTGYLKQVEQRSRVFPVVAILGPRQCGKTTLARMFMRQVNGDTFYDLESPEDRARLAEPQLTLLRHQGWVVLDEIQRMPELFEVLRVLADRPERRAQFLVLGSAAPEMVKNVSDTLAGRVGFVDLSGFSLDEVGVAALEPLWIRGGFPRSFLAADDQASAEWRLGFVRTFLERDVPQLGFNISAEALRRFWTMVAHYHGQVWNASEFARSIGASESTARRYLDLLAGAYVVRVLSPWYENMKKRQVKAPKVYIRDSGLLHTLLGVDAGIDVLAGHPKVGASWEGFVIEQVIQRLGRRDVYFWATHGGAELDLLLFRRGKRIGIEIKYTASPRLGRSLHIATRDLGLDRAMLIHAGRESFALSEKVDAVPLPEALLRLSG